jgi:RNA polymerase sigma-70 factor (ECF subfamily)
VADRQQPEAPHRAITYCIVPEDLAEKLHEPLRRHFADDRAIEVVVEQRWRARRRPRDRRAKIEAPPAGEERRRIRAPTGRRVADRRSAVLPAPVPLDLPRKALPFADHLLFVERLEPSGQDAEDRDTARLVTRIQGGADDQFGDLYRRYFDRIYAYLRIALSDDQLAEDATQQVFVKVLEALPRYEPRGKPFRAWLFTIVRNEGISVLRARRRTSVEDPMELARWQDRLEADDAADHVLGWIEDRELLLFIERLPASQRQVLILRYMLDLSHREIAEILRRTQVDVRAQQHRALRFLEARLTALGRSPTERERSGWQRRATQARVLRNRRFALLS